MITDCTKSKFILPPKSIFSGPVPLCKSKRHSKYEIKVKKEYVNFKINTLCRLPIVFYGHISLAHPLWNPKNQHNAQAKTSNRKSRGLANLTLRF